MPVFIGLQPDEIATADSAYRCINEGIESIRVEHARVATRRPGWLDVLLSLRSQKILAGRAALLPAIEALSEHLGGPTFPGAVSIAIR